MARENHLYYKPTKEGMEKIERLRLKVIELDDLIDELTNDGVMITVAGKDECGNDTSDIIGPVIPIVVSRSVSIAKTKLEECRQRAIEAIVRLHNDGV